MNEGKGAAIWTRGSTARFWEYNKGSFAGDTTAPEVLRLVLRHVTGRVLDVGTGSGALLDLIPNSVGVDIVARHSRTVAGSIDALPFADDSFNTVFAMNVLEHLSSSVLRDGLLEVRRVLKLGGKLIAVVPNDEDMTQNIVYCPCCQHEFHRWGHLQRFDTQSITELLAAFRATSTTAVPLGLMAEHWLIRHFWRLFLLCGFCKASDLLAVAEK